jgi:hypothetical protein
MPIVSFATTGVVGLNYDIPQAELQAPAWTNGSNVRFQDGSAQAIRGDAAIADTSPFQPTWAFPFTESLYDTTAWILPGEAAVQVFYANAISDITNILGPYTGLVTDRWSGGALGGLFILNNGVDVPQVWPALSVANPLIDMANWQTDVRAECMRSFKNFLVALDITKNVSTSPVRYRTMVKWSHPADPGFVPPSWDETDTTKDAGEYSLTETAAAVVDAVPMKDNLIIYKEDSVWGMQFIGGTLIFRFYKIFSNFGMPQRDCAVEFQAGQHLVFTGDDIILHDGNTFESVATNKIRSVLRKIDIPQLASCYMCLHVARNEVWFCYRKVQDGAVMATSALIYNWIDKTWGVRDLADYYCVTPGRISPNPLIWTAATFPWQSAQQDWSEISRTSAIPRLFAVGPTYCYWADVTQYVGGTVRFERTHIGIPVKAKEPPDLSSVKFLRRLWPRFKGANGLAIQVQLGVHDEPNEAVTWKPPQQYIIGISRWIDTTLNGKLFAVRFSVTNGTNWIFSGMDADMEYGGEQ